MLAPSEGPDRRLTTEASPAPTPQAGFSRPDGRRRVSRLRQTEIDKAPRDGNVSRPGASSFSRGEIVTTSALSPSLPPPQLHRITVALPVSGIPPEARHQARHDARLRPALRVLRAQPLDLGYRDARPCLPAVARRSARAGQRRCRVRRVQPHEGRAAADRVLHAISVGRPQLHRSTRARYIERSSAAREKP